MTCPDCRWVFYDHSRNGSRYRSQRPQLPPPPSCSSPDQYTQVSAAAGGDEGAAIDLGGLAAGDGVDDLDGLGDLVGGEAGPGVADDLLGRWRGRGVGGFNDGVDPAAPLRVAQADDDDVGDAGVADKGGFDLGGEDVGAAGDDHVDAPVDEVEVAAFVEVAHVARGREAVLGGVQAGGGAKVAVAVVERRAQVDIADLPGREVLAVGVEDANLGAAYAAADAALVAHPLVGAQRGQAQGLGHAVGHHDALGADQLGPAVQERGRHRRRALEDPLDAGQVAGGDAGPVGDALEHRRGGGERGDAVPLDNVDHARRIELLHDDQAVPGEQAVERG